MPVRVKAGIFLVHKPTGISSTRCLNQVKLKLQSKTIKFGHGGSLDPFASGLLIILVGGATKLFTLFLRWAKTYFVQTQLHVATVTGDRTGLVIATTATANPPRSQVKQLFAYYRQGWRYRQQIPFFSAASYRGKKFYQYARSGQTPPIRFKSVTIHWLRLDSYRRRQAQINFVVNCSSGCYVRALVVDLAAKMNLIATTIELVRTAIGPWKLAQAVTPEKVGWNRLISIKTVLNRLGIPIVILTAAQYQSAVNGAVLWFDLPHQLIAVTDLDETLLFIYQHQNGVFGPLTKIY